MRAFRPCFDAARRWAVALACAVGLLPGLALAHQASDAYLFFDATEAGTAMRWDIALRDLDAVLPIDADGDRQLTWAEVRAAWPSIDALATESLKVEGCRFGAFEHALEQRSDGAYAVLKAQAGCQVSAGTPMQYQLLREVDATHRGVVRITGADGVAHARVLNPEALPAEAAAAAATGFFQQGVHHIVTGYDHLLFLLCLLLPAVLRREQGRWQAVASWRDALWPVAGVVTLFTLAHSITLAASALGWVHLPSWFIEPAIAVTIALAALDNLRPLFGRRRGAITFAFGLVHGFGFAGVLSELALPRAEFGWALLQFNAGLEAGQLAVVALVVPLLFLLRERRLYVPAVVQAGSAAAMMMAAVWWVERTVDLRLLPF